MIQIPFSLDFLPYEPNIYFTAFFTKLSIEFISFFALVVVFAFIFCLHLSFPTFKNSVKKINYVGVKNDLRDGEELNHLAVVIYF